MYVIPWLHLYDRYLSKFHKRWNTDSIALYTERKQYKCCSGDQAEEPQLKAKQLSMVALSFVLLAVIYVFKVIYGNSLQKNDRNCSFKKNKKCNKRKLNLPRV